MSHNESAQERLQEGLILYNGIHTCQHSKHGHFTVKLYTAKSGKLTGQRIVTVQWGPNVMTDWKGVGTWNESKRSVSIWKRYCSPDRRRQLDGLNWDGSWNRIEKKVSIWLDLSLRGENGYWYAEGYRLETHAHCLVCNRALTEPESIKAGIGPTCRGAV